MSYIMRSALAILISGSILNAAPVLSETFENGLGAWTDGTAEITAVNTWSDSSDYAVATASNLAPNFSRLLVSPQMNLSGISNPYLFLLYRASCSSSNVELNVYYQEPPSTQWNAYHSFSLSTTEQQGIIPLSNSSTSYKLGFEVRNASTSPCMVSIDEVTVGSDAEVLVSGVRFSGIQHELVSLPNITQPNGSTHGTISITVPYGTSRTSLTPLFAGLAAAVTPSGAQDLSTTKSFTVQSKDGSTSKIYDLSVNWAPASTAASVSHLQLCEGTVCSDSVKIEAGSTAADTGTITAYFLEGEALTKLTPSIVISANASSFYFPAAGPFDLSQTGKGLVVTVTAQDGTTKRYYKVITQSVPVVNYLYDLWMCDPNGYSISSRAIWDPAKATDTGRVVFDLPYGRVITDYKICGDSVSKGSVYSKAGALNTKGTGITVTLKNGPSTRYYAVSASVRSRASTDAKAVLVNLLPNKGNGLAVVGTLEKQPGAGTVGVFNVKLKTGTDPSNFKWYFGMTDAFGYVDPTDGNSTNDWTGATSRIFKLTAEDMVTSLDYLVNIVREDQAKSVGLTAFVVWQGALQVAGIIDTIAHTVKVQLPLEGNLKRLYCTLGGAQGATASITSSDYHDFSTPLKFTLYSPDLSKSAEYTVTVTQAPASIASLHHSVTKLNASIANGILTVDHRGLELSQISIYNMFGQRVANTTEVHGTQSTLDLHSHSGGVYILRATSKTSAIKPQRFFKH